MFGTVCSSKRITFDVCIKSNSFDVVFKVMQIRAYGTSRLYSIHPLFSSFHTVSTLQASTIHCETKVAARHALLLFGMNAVIWKMARDQDMLLGCNL